MDFDLDLRTVSLSVGELADFTVLASGAPSGHAGLWRAQAGAEWHRRLRERVGSEVGGARFEVPIEGRLVHRGWVFALTGRIDQWLPADAARQAPLIREVKTVLGGLPAPDDALRAAHPGHFAQAAAYRRLQHLRDADSRADAELVLVELGSGLLQTVRVCHLDEEILESRLDAVARFLDQRRRARDRLAALRLRPAFRDLRPGQEGVSGALADALSRHPFVALEAPTGFGKTGVLLEAALGLLRAGRFSRLVYLTGKSTGQIQVVDTLRRIVGAGDRGEDGALAVWQVRAKAEHCVNREFHCVREACGYLDGFHERWESAGLSRFVVDEHQPRDLDSLRAAGLAAYVCPYEITRAALAYNDVWIGDYNYVFHPRNRALFAEQPGFDPRSTLLVVDEAHNLPARAADARSLTARLEDAQDILARLEDSGAGGVLVRAWTAWAGLLASLPVGDSLDPAVEDDATDALRRLADAVSQSPPNPANLGAEALARLWETAEFAPLLTEPGLRFLVWSPRAGELRFTCLDAASAVGRTVAEYGAVVFVSATFGPLDVFSDAVGLPTAAASGNADVAPVLRIAAPTPWRDQAYRTAVDLRVDTTYRRREAHAETTARTIVRLRQASAGPVAVFFPSYRYAELIARLLSRDHPGIRAEMQPRLTQLAEQTAWVEEALALSDALFLVLGSSFAEGIDLLGGRITHAMVVGPALPEVNAVQRARVDAFRTGTPAEAFRRVYQIPGMQKVNQALGRLVRAPGQTARILLHCRRFHEATYAALLDPAYSGGTPLLDDSDLDAWLS